ncbi:MAG: serine--tRNA ligase [Candidatus Aenigmatarchaeota archaeon]
MLDMKFIRENTAVVEASLRKRGDIDGMKQLDELLKLDKDWRRQKQIVEEKRAKKNTVTEEIAKIKDASEKKRNIDEMRKLVQELAKDEDKLTSLRTALDYILLRMPNLLHKSVPSGKDEKDNKLVRVFGKKPTFDFAPQDHIDIATKLDLVDIERAAKTSGARFYYLKNELVELEYAILRMAMDILKKEKFVFHTTPTLLRGQVMQGAGFLPMGEEDIYRIVNEDLYLAGTSEQALAGLHMNETLEKETLPRHYAGFSTCFRTEAGSHGRDTKGIFRVHQFDKLEMFIYSKPEDSWKEYEKLIDCAEKIFQELGLHYRVVNVCAGEIGNVAAKKYDIEAWLPGQNAYREMGSCSNCTDYQAVGLNIKCRDKNGNSEYVHTLNSTAFASSRTLIAIIENYQQKDGSVAVPKALQKYVSFKKIAANK